MINTVYTAWTKIILLLHFHLKYFQRHPTNTKTRTMNLKCNSLMIFHLYSIYYKYIFNFEKNHQTSHLISREDISLPMSHCHSPGVSSIMEISYSRTEKHLFTDNWNKNSRDILIVLIIQILDIFLGILYSMGASWESSTNPQTILFFSF